MMKKLGKKLKEVISRVNSTLRYYEKDYVSAQRTPDIERERCNSLREYIEIRFNYEARKVPELQKFVDSSEGRLFKCIEIQDEDTAKRRFKVAKVSIDRGSLPADLLEDLDSVIKLMGGSLISFNNVKEKIKYKIEDE